MSSEREIGLWRRAERKRLIALRLAVPPEQRRRRDAAIERRLEALLRALPGRSIGLYWPVRGEFDPRPVAERLIAQARLLALPAAVDPQGPLEYRLWRPGTEMEPGPHGIPAPKAREILRPDILIVPLVGFDEARHRLGYGGGYFDRTLAAASPRPTTVGVGFEATLLATIFPQPHDAALDFIVTEARLRQRHQ
ncbi:MAG TPA: 5-formyltetrahydrofolate cyclo-ligase [Stellaceae bacterium]|nr:5-formyltetrahydrofolate cyclo-ligase [Stellaceae bacterium]